MTVYRIVENMPKVSEEEIKEILNSVICRCTGYKQMIEAIRYVMEPRK